MTPPALSKPESFGVVEEIQEANGLNQLESETLEPQASKPKLDLLPVPESEFVSEELPPDFWDSEPLAPSEDSELESTHAESETESSAKAKPVITESLEIPLFAELQALFPGRIIRIDAPEAEKERDEEVVVQTDVAEAALEPDPDED